jgi:hypothetical protein
MSQERRAHMHYFAKAKAYTTALGYLARLNLTGLDAPTDTTATELADRLWREVSPSGTAPEALVNACYRAMEAANA